MKPQSIADGPSIGLGLHDEIRRSKKSRYVLHLPGVLLVAQDISYVAT